MFICNGACWLGGVVKSWKPFLGVCSAQSVVFSGGVHQSPVRVSSIQNAEMPQQKHLFRQGLLGEGGANYFWSRNSALLNIEVVLRRASIQSYSQ